MSNNNNQNFPSYVESDLNKSRSVAPPRIKKREKDIYIYQTNKTIKSLESSKGLVSISSKFELNIKADITTPLNFDIAKPKFENPSSSQIWGTQINGFIFEDINLDPLNYSYFSFNIASTSDQVKKQTKYRIINIDKEFDNNGKFLYASFNAIVDSTKTFPSFEQWNWKLVSQFQSDKKTKYIKLKFEKEALLSFNGINIVGAAEKGFTAAKVNYSINQAPELTLLYIKVRQTNPIEYDFPAYAYLAESKTYIVDVDWLDRPFGPSFGFIEVTRKGTYIRALTNDGGWDETKSRIINRPKYFFNGLNFYKRRDRVVLDQETIQLQDMRNFLSGTANVEGLVPSKLSPLNTDSSLQKINDLDPNDTNDREYLVLAKKFELSNWFDITTNNVTEFAGIYGFEGFGSNTIGGSGSLQNKRGEKTRLYRKNEFNNIIYDDGENEITIEIELVKPVFDPKLTIDSLNSDTIKITTYDENHTIIENELNFQSSFAIDDSEPQTEIQL